MTAAFKYLALDVNPEPWAIGPVGFARSAGKMSAYVGRNQQLDAYKQAIAEAAEVQLPMGHAVLTNCAIEMEFYFWRNRAEYTTASQRQHMKHNADLTNLVKSTEDALQGIIFNNDKQVTITRSVLVEQDNLVQGCVVVGWRVADVPVIPSIVWELVTKLHEQQEHHVIGSMSHDPAPEDIF